MATGDLRAAIEYASQNPKSDFANQLNQRIASGQADGEAQKLGIDLTPIKQYAVKQNPIAAPVAEPTQKMFPTVGKDGLSSTIASDAKSVANTFGDTFKAGANEVTDAISNVPKNAQAAGGGAGADILAGLGAAGHVAGAVAGTAGGLVGDVIAPLIPDPVKSKIGDVSKYISEKVNQIPGMTPEIHKGLADVFNTLTLEGGAKTEPIATDLAKAGIEKGGDVINTAGNSVVDKVNDISSTTVATNAAKQATKQSDFIEKLITPEMNAKATTSAIKTGKVAEGEGILGKRDMTSTVPGFDNIKASVEKVPGISSKNTALQNVNLIHDSIGTTAQDLKSQLKGKGQFTQKEFQNYMTGVKNTLTENPLITGDAETTANKIINKFNSLIKTNGYDAEGLLNARQQLDQWMSAQKGANVFDPKTETAVSTALKGIRQGGNDFIASKVPDVQVKGMLAHQSNLYRAIDNIAPKAAKEGTSKLGRVTKFVKKNPVATAFVGDKILKATTGLGY